MQQKDDTLVQDTNSLLRLSSPTAAYYNPLSPCECVSPAPDQPGYQTVSLFVIPLKASRYCCCNPQPPAHGAHLSAK
eukprot:scaffold98762_cov22-Tisochrysis_lutea.AAC.1